MKTVRDILWQKPIIRAHTERKVSFLELFFDLIFVICIARIAHPLNSHLSLQTIGRYVLLFIPIFWAWIGSSFYHDISGHNDLRTRLYTLIEMIIIGGIATYSDGAFTQRGGVIFALLLALLFFVEAAFMWRIGVYNKEVRSFNAVFTIIKLIAVGLFALSTLFAVPIRIAVWIAAYILIICSALISAKIKGAHPLSKTALSSSLRERFGLFTIIVLGEMLFGVINGISHDEIIGLRKIGLGILGIIMTLSVWWVYFDYLGWGNLKPATVQKWNMFHALLTMAIPPFGIGISLIIDVHHAENSLLLSGLVGGSIICILAAAKGIMTCIEKLVGGERFYRMGQNSLTITILLTVGALLLRYFALISVDLFLVLCTLLLFIPVLKGIQIWVSMKRTTDAQASSETVSATE